MELSAVEKYMLLLLYANRNGVRGRLWLQKEMFELAHAFDELRKEADYEAYPYGPSSERVDKVLDTLQNSGLIDEELKLTEEGLKLAEKLWREEDEKNKAVIKRVKDFYESLDKDELLLYVYTKHKDMASKSEVKKAILGRRVSIALKMLREGKISIGLAAELAGLTIDEMRKLAIKKGIKPYILEDIQ